jgi:dTDP-4-dehydrorhamnose reductase
MRLLVLGASGLVGSELCRRAGGEATVLGAARHVEGAATRVIDLADPASVVEGLKHFEPDAVAICSAWPHVDGCESDPARSHRENVQTVQNLVDATAGSRTRLLFFSTDHVFDGKKQGRYVESDPVNPLSVYAKHKREVEELLLTRGHSLICRTAWVFGVEARRKNFVYRVIEHARSGLELKVPSDQSGCPTWTGWLCESAWRLLADGAEGIVHLAGEGEFTKAQWAREISGSLGLPAVNVVEADWRLTQVAPRPNRVAMASERHRLQQPDVTGILKALAGELTRPS